MKLAAGESSSSFDQAQRHTSSGFLSSTTIASRTTSDQTKAVATELSGRNVAINASRDVAVTGSNVLSDAGTAITAGRNVDITAATENSASSSDYSKRSSGLLGGGGLSLTLGTRSQSSAQKQAGDTAAGSVIGSTGGNVSIQAGQTYTQTGSDVLAPQGDIGIQAKKVDITEAREKRSDSSEQKFSQSGITVALSVPVIEAVQGVTQMAGAVQATRSARMQAMGTAMAAVKTSDALDAAKATAQSLSEGKVPDGVSLSVSLGSSQSRSSSTSTSESGRGSTLAAGGSIAIQATGAGQGSDLTVRGSSVQSGGDIALKADNRVRVLGSQDETQQGGSDSSGSAAIGLSVGLGEQSAGLSLNLAASRALGSRNGSATTQQDSTVAAGKALTIDSGGDTDILGGTASGETVKARVGGDLNLASLQDTAQFKEDSKNAGFNASIPIPGMSTGTASASLSAGKTALRSDYASTQTTSGIKSGDGGFDVQVKGKTTLDGAVIASSDKAVTEGRNRFRSEGGLELKDITNSAKYSADSVSVGVGISGAASKDTGAKPVQKSGPALNGAGLGSDSGSAGSVTKAGISGIAGDTAVRSGDVGSGIKPIFDADTVRADVNAQVVITKDFSPAASNYIGKVGDGHLDEAAALEVQATRAREAGNTELADRLALQAQELKDNWGPDGKLRVLAHMAVGALAGGVDGAVGAGAGTVTAPAVMAQLEKSGLPEDLAKGIVGAASTTVGAIAGGTAGGAAAMNEVANNYLDHHRRGNMLNMSEVEQFQKASESCSKTGDPDACGKVKELTALSQGRDRKLGAACGGGPEASSVACNSLIQDAVAKGNITKGKSGEFVWADSPNASFPLNVAVAGPPSQREDFHSRAARSTATGTLLLLPGPEDFVLGAVLATKTGQMIAEAALVGGQKVWRFVDGATAKFGSKEAEAIARARVENNFSRDAGVDPYAITTPKISSAPTANGTADAASGARLAEDLRHSELNAILNAIAVKDPRLAAAVRGGGDLAVSNRHGEVNFGIGESTAGEADRLGKIWVGQDARFVSNQEQCPGCLVSSDGTRLYRPPAQKTRASSVLNPTGIQANFVTLRNGKVLTNGHLNIK
ncbi:hemagglutinin repeat-containing protein [Comamonadaceae bacterium SL12-8]|uniref:Hemagglutinin repeat-containing protein n=1 Tax=Amphibiibacter pelophylacis TaxID=1799477 RepID=A0ACC6P4R1_9BURK